MKRIGTTNPDGPSTHVSELARTLTAVGVDVTLICQVRSQPGTTPPSLTVVPIRTDSTVGRAGALFEGVRRAWLPLRSTDLDVIYARSDVSTI